MLVLVVYEMMISTSCGHAKTVIECLLCLYAELQWRLRARLRCGEGCVVRAGERVEKGDAVAIIDGAAAVAVKM